MERREMLGLLGAGAVGMVALSGRSARGDDTHSHKKHDAACEACMEKCMKACVDCAKICNQMAAHCLEMLCEGQGDRHMHARSHELGMDCQAFCVLSAQMMAHDSELMTHSCRACSEACEKEKDSKIMAECAEKCRACEASCREMVRMMQA